MHKNKDINKTKKIKTIDIVHIGLSVALIAICSWISIPLTIPITLQTMAVCIIAALFGSRKSIISIVIYILLGAIGVPVFHGFTSGMGIVLGSTGGYMIGFVFTALFIGTVADKTNKFIYLTISMILGILVCYIFGTAWFYFVYSRANGGASIMTILSWCVFPFIIPDVVKAVIAALLTNRLKKYIKIKK